MALIAPTPTDGRASSIRNRTGLPMAITNCPISRLSELPNDADGSPSAVFRGAFSAGGGDDCARRNRYYNREVSGGNSHDVDTHVFARSASSRIRARNAASVFASFSIFLQACITVA